MWVHDNRHWLNDEQTGPGVPQLRLKVAKLSEIITYATSRDSGLAVDDPPKCWRRPKRKACAGRLNILFTEDYRIYWACPACGDEGLLDGWHGLVWDMGIYDEEEHITH